MLNRRKWLTTASGLASLAACGRTKGTGFNGYALVANAGENSLAVVDLTAFRLAKTIALSAAPAQVLVGPDVAYALTPENGTVHIIDQEPHVSKSRRLADRISVLGMAADRKSILALAPHSNELIQADLATLEPRGHHKFSVKADKVDFSSTGLAAAASLSGWVELLDLETGKRNKIQTPPLGGVRFRSDGKLLLVANLQGRSLLALDVPTLKTVAELPLSMQPDELCFNADQGQLFVSGEGMDGVAVIFPFYTLEVDQTLLAGRDPGTMACSESPAYLFVGSRTGSDLCILNIDTRKVIGFVEMGGRSSFITVTPDSQYALALNQEAGSMGVIRVPTQITGEERRLKSAASLFTMISVGSKPVHAAVISRA